MINEELLKTFKMMFKNKVVRLETRLILDDGQTNLTYIGEFGDFIDISEKEMMVMLGRNYAIHYDFSLRDYIELNKTTGKYELIERKDKIISELALVSLGDIVGMSFY